MNVFLDIETIPQQAENEAKTTIAETITAPATMKKPETITDWHNGVGKYAGEKEKVIDVKYRATSFDGSKGQICSIAFAVEGGNIISYTDALGEKDILNSFFDYLLLHTKDRPPFFIGHYIGGFDLKFLFQRCVINNICPPFKLPFYGRHDNHFYDTMQAWCGYKDKISQDNLCKALGIEGKPSDIDGSKVWDYYKDGRIDEIEEYNRDDVNKVRQIYNRLNFKGG